MNEIERISDELARIYDGEAWHGLSLTEALANVSAAQATARPIAAAHGIREIVAHIAVWNRAWAKRLSLGTPQEVPPERDFPAHKELTEEQWQAELIELKDSYAELLTRVR